MTSARRQVSNSIAKSTAPRYSVALLVETSNTHGRHLLEGIVEFSGSHGRWVLHLCELSRGGVPPSWMRSWKGDGVIARIENPRIAAVVSGMRCPAVDLSAARLIPAVPVVETDDRAIARLAAEHLLERGLRHFGFCGDTRYKWSRYRQTHFEQSVRARGYSCSSLNPRHSANLDTEYAAIASWLSHLPKPVGIMTCYDIRAHHVLEICLNLGLQVPDEVAVVGVDNEPLLCQLAAPPLTSVVLNSRRMGYIAAGLLQRMMAGKPVDREVHLVEPIGLVARQSTDVLLVGDPIVAQAVRFIHMHACEGIDVGDVMRHVPVSRRALEMRFKKVVGHSPHQEILRVRVRRVEELLKESRLPLHVIAERTGFRHAEYLSVVFKRRNGVWPSAFRMNGER